MDGFDSQVTGSLFIAAASMLWLGWMLLPAKIGAYFVPADFPRVGTSRRLWIWLYRLHLFGYVGRHGSRGARPDSRLSDSVTG